MNEGEKKKVTLWREAKPLHYIATLHAIVGPYGEFHVVMNDENVALLRGQLEEGGNDGSDYQKERGEGVH